MASSPFCTAASLTASLARAVARAASSPRLLSQQARALEAQAHLGNGLLAALPVDWLWRRSTVLAFATDATVTGPVDRLGAPSCLDSRCPGANSRHRAVRVRASAFSIGVHQQTSSVDPRPLRYSAGTDVALKGVSCRNFAGRVEAGGAADQRAGVARRGNDRLTVAVAAALKRAFGGWRQAHPRPRREDRTSSPLLRKD